MSEEIKVGARVTGSFGEGTVIGLHENRYGRCYAWVEWDTGSCFGSHVDSLTRIEPDVPKAKFSVGQDALSPGGSKVRVMAIGHAYQTDYPDGTRVWWPEPDLRPVLEAVPACSHCGQEIPGLD